MNQPHISFSQIKLFDECARKYWHIYINSTGRRQLPNDLMQQGSDAHELIADTIHALREQQIASVAPETPAKAWHDDMLKWAYTTPKDCLHIEHEILIETPYLPIKCVIDLLILDGNRAKIVDWKLNRLPEHQEFDQLALYAAAVMFKYPQITEVLASYAVINSEKKIYTTHLFDAAEASEVYRHWRRIAESSSKRSIEKASYDLSPGTKCKTCPFAGECVGNDYSFSSFALMTDQDLIKTYYVHDALAAQLKEEVRSRMESREINELYADSEGFSYKGAMTLREAKLKPLKKTK